MPNRRKSHWTTLMAVGLPLLVAGCAGDSSLFSTDKAAPSAASSSPSAKAGSTSVMQLADKLSAEKNFSNAAAMYSQAHQNSPNDIAPLLGLGRSLLAMGANGDAANAYSQALALQPTNMEALRGLGHARILLGQPDFAMVPYQTALKQDPKDLRSLNGLGVAQDMSGDHKAAQATYKTALAIDPTNQSARNNLALSLALSGDESGAIKMLEDVNKSSTATSVNRQNLALVYGASGRLDDAKRVSSADLPEQRVEQNLAALSAKTTDKNREAVLKSALGVELKGVQYVPAPRPVVPLNNLALSPADETPIYLSGSSGEQMATISVDAVKPKKKQKGLAGSVEDEAWAEDWNEELVDATDVNPTQPAPATQVAAAPATSTPVADAPLPPSPDLQPVAASPATAAATPEPAPAAEPAPTAIATTATGTTEPPAKAEEPAAPAVKPTVKAEPLPAPKLEKADPAPVAASVAAPAEIVTPPASSSTPAAPAVTVATTSGGAKVYTLQLASYRNEAEAAKGWQALTTDQGDLLSGLPHTVEKADLGTDKGVYFRLKAGSFSDIKQAKSLCKDLKVRSVDCMVIEATPASASSTSSADKVQQSALPDKPIMVGSRW
jgi:Flp pilus assembly protein TadD